VSITQLLNKKIFFVIYILFIIAGLLRLFSVVEPGLFRVLDNTNRKNISIMWTFQSFFFRDKITLSTGHIKTLLEHLIHVLNFKNYIHLKD
jgi:hypothetical protein